MKAKTLNQENLNYIAIELEEEFMTVVFTLDDAIILD